MTDTIVRRPRGGRIRPVYLYAAGGLAVAGALLWTRHNRNNATAGDPGTTVDPNADSGAYTDYGSSDYYNGDYSGISGNYGGTTPGLYGYYDPSTGAFITGSGSTVTAPTNNAQWTQQATAYLVGQGYNPTAVLTALGAALAGVGLTQHQYDIVTAAIAAEGQPPQGFKKPPFVAPAAGQPSLKPAPRLTLASQTKTHATLAWTQVQGATHYRLRHALTGTVVYDGPGHSAVVTRPKTGSHAFIVVAYDRNKQVSKESNRVSVTHQ